MAVYPRVGGGTFTRLISVHWSHGLSPRGRGNRCSDLKHRLTKRSIPAWAGEPSSIRLRPRTRTVYPRVGGGTDSISTLPAHCGGLSPRGRGNHPDGANSEGTLRSIPAWAGEPPISAKPVPASKVYPRVGGGTLAGASVPM